MYRSTASWSRYWSERKIDWNAAYLSGWNHPHRERIIKVLRDRPFTSLCELGCASGPNLLRIHKEFPTVQLGGTDVSEDAIDMAKKVFINGVFEVRSADDLFFSDNSVDVVLTDMTLIYLDPFRIKKALREMKRVARRYVVLVELHHGSWLMRQALRFTSGYHAYDYGKLLKEAGFYDVEVSRLTESDWPGGQPQKTYGNVITASVR